jgi:Tub family
MKTKPPLWNEEHQTFVHNFGCRVKKATNRNFIVVEERPVKIAACTANDDKCLFTPMVLCTTDSAGNQEDDDDNDFESEKSLLTSMTSGDNTVNQECPHRHPVSFSSGDVLVRHGAVSNDEFILDFRESVDPCVALALVTAVHSGKTLVRL